MILSIETATTVGSVALHQEGKLVGSYELHLERSHASAITQLIEHLLKISDVRMTDIQAIAISKGPGSYTGLRIGTSTAKGLCFGLDIPLIAVNTLQAMAKSVSKFYQHQAVLLCPMIDARRMEVYTAYFTPDMGSVKETHAKIINENSFKAELSERQVVLFGNGAPKCAAVLQHPQLHLIEGVSPQAREIGEIASQKFMQQEFEDLAYFEPFYLKDFVAGKPKNKVLGHLINH
ncbi:MAG: tRNA (adenosine(37)-N6)-threonylcarbamoyltransferase complex dimerization subunit type 1 TsaB [Flammeovirgaceae bacterium]